MTGMEESMRYSKILVDIPPEHPFALLRSMLRTDDSVLDLGCGSGEVGAYLAEAGVVVDGVEVDESRAAIARTRLHNVFVGEIGEAIIGLRDTYTAVTFIDVLEHLVDPVAALRWAANRAEMVYVFIPNGAHYTARWKILRGDWSYSESGLFDRDHLHFYDLDTMVDLVRRAGLECEGMWPRIAIPRWAPKRLLRRWPNLFASGALMRTTSARAEA